MADLEASSFYQEYDEQSREQQSLLVFCRMCRRAFPIKLRAPDPEAKLTCACGHSNPISEFDIFSDQGRLNDFATWYEGVVSAVHDALREANLPVPKTEEPAPPPLQAPPPILEEVAPALPDTYRQEFDALRSRLLSAREDIVRYHNVLSQIIELSYVHRQRGGDARQNCIEACRRDISLVPRIIREVQRRRAAGQTVNLSFHSFKHLVTLLEEDNRFEAALSVALNAQRIGLKGYEERIQRLQKLVKSLKFLDPSS